MSAVISFTCTFVISWHFCGFSWCFNAASNFELKCLFSIVLINVAASWGVDDPQSNFIITNRPCEYKLVLVVHCNAIFIWSCSIIRLYCIPLLFSSLKALLSCAFFLPQADLGGVQCKKKTKNSKQELAASTIRSIYTKAMQLHARNT